jgi:hypothetical protein
MLIRKEMAEREGFEPSEPKGFTPLAGVRIKPLCHLPLFFFKKMAEKQGFEPWVSCDTTVFKTVAFDHSAISPRYYIFLKNSLNKNGSPDWIRTNDQMVNSHLLYH